MHKSSKTSGNSSSSTSTRHTERSINRYNIGTRLIDEEKFKQDHNQVYNDDSKFARQLKKLLREEEEESKIQKILDLSSYLDHHENIKFVLKLGKQSLNILLKLLSEQHLNESKNYLVECISKIGSIIMTDRDPHKYFDWVIEVISVVLDENSKESSKDNNIKCLVMDAVNQSFLNEMMSRYMKENIDFILGDLKKLLESSDNPNLMMKVARTILLLAKSYPYAINNIFQDVVDILIAWHIDINQSDEVIEFTSNSLVEFRSNWLNDLNFTFNLLEQFVEDIESYLKAYLDDSNKRRELENIEKIAALFKVYHTVIKSISCIDDRYNQPLKTILTKNEIEILVSTLRIILNSVLKIYKTEHSELLFKPANNSLILFCDIFNDTISFGLSELLIDYLKKENTVEHTWYDHSDLSFLNLINKVIGYFITSNNIDLINQILSYDGRLWNYKFSQNTKIIQECLNIYKSLIVVKSIPVVQEVYKNILYDTDLSFKTILKYSNSNDILSLINDEEPIGDAKGLGLLNSIKYAENNFLFNLCVFAELGNAKNNLILMYTLSPTLFELLTNKLSPLNWSLAENFPNIQYALLNRLYTHCQRHENFIVTSSLFANKYGTDSPTRDYFRIIIETITKLISHPTTSLDISVILLNWSIKLIESITVENGSILSTNLFINFINSIITCSYSHEDEIVLLGHQMFVKILQRFDKISESCLNRILDLCKYFMMNSNSKIRYKYMKLLTMMPINLSLSHKTDIKTLTYQDFSNFSSISRNNYILSSSDCVISMENFKSIMSFVLAGIKQDNETFEKKWLERIFFSCRRPVNEDKLKEAGKDSMTIDPIIENHDGILWFWALWECAQFCVQSRLKTPLGKAQDTFVAIESVLKNYFNYEQQSQTMDKGKNSFTDLNRISLLLHFVDHLERLIYNAYEGIATGQHMVSKAVKLFFRTNKSTCNEWFSRVRFFLSLLSTKSGNYEIAIRHCWEYLQYCFQHNLTTSSEFDQIVQSLIKCYTKLGSWQQLLGLYEWLNKSIKKTGLEWIKIAAEEAQGKLEIACSGYKEILNKNLEDLKINNQSSNSHFSLVKYQTERIMECYYQLSDWNGYLNWFNELKLNHLDHLENQNLANQLEKYIDLNYIKSLASFDDGDFNSVLNKNHHFNAYDSLISYVDCKWNFEEIERVTMREIHKTLMFERFQMSEHKGYCENFNNQFSTILNIDEMSQTNHEKLILTLFLNYLQNQEDQIGLPFLNNLKLNPTKYNMKYLNIALMISKNYDFNLDLNLSCARLARKQQNKNLSLRLLDQQLKYFNNTLDNNSHLFTRQNEANFYDSVARLMNDVHQITDYNLKLKILEFSQESSKFLATCNYSFESVDISTKSILNFVNFEPDMTPLFTPGVPYQNNKIFKDNLNEKCSFLLMNLSKFLAQNTSILKNLNFFNSENLSLNEQIGSNINKILSLKYNDISKFNLKDNFLNPESIIGNLLDLSTVLSPKIPKTWYSLGNWCYKWGKKYADKIQSLNKLSQSDISKDPDVNNLLELLPVHCSDEEKKLILEIYSNCLSLNHTQDENLQNPIFQFNKELFRIQAQSQLYENCQSLCEEKVNLIIQFFMNSIDRVIYYHRIACKSYFMFLKLSEKGTKLSDEKNITSSLRIIKLMVKYAIELREDLKNGLDETPSEPWKNIIPQLFSRLNHPEVYVRESVSQLLCRIAKDFPHLIIYPAVVGSQDGPTKIETVHSRKNDNSLFENLGKSQQEEPKLESKIEIENESDLSEEENSGELSDELEQEVEDEENVTNNYEDYVQDDTKSELKNAYKYLLDTLTDSNRTMIDQVKLFVHEMRRITLLREELWYGTLNQIHSDLNKRVEQLNLEIQKTNSNTYLTDSEKQQISTEKYEILLQPIVSILEHVQEITTNLPPETPNEEMFQLEFEDKIKDVINLLKSKDNYNKPSNCIVLFKQLHNTFHHRSQRRQSTSLQMDQISPKLYNLKSTSIPIPGKDGNFVNIYSIANSVLVLPTKTKPKKLFFIGSNGRRYPYLFKGLEDLHLDERIMQLLNIVNTMFTKINKTETINYHALNYSVTPLGPRSGLISWVEGATPLFNLYKKWQHREAVYLASKNQQQQQQQQQIHIMRPNDIYYSKLNPILKEKGIKNFQENRAECPVGILKKVLEDLIKETPGDLLTKELWCNSSTPANWWNSVQIFSRSTSVMSMIGYVIGLGDRHLDNVLVNLRTGQVVHIDYNICFEKGHNLRVPEKVPFRMTQNIQNALGMTGVEGLFRRSSENVMSILRQKREILLTLLEAFVYDPLLDWTGHDTGIIASFYGGGNSKIKTEDGEIKKETRKNIEKKQNLHLYEIRLIENRVPMDQNQKQLETYIGQNLTRVKILNDIAQKKGLNDNLIRLNEQAKIYLDESVTLHETMKSKTTHPVYTLHDRYNDYLIYNQNLELVNSSLDAEIQNLNSLSTGHLDSINFFKSNLNLEPNCDVKKSYNLVSDFLKSSGQVALIDLGDKIYENIQEQKIKLKLSLKNIKEISKHIFKILKFMPNDLLSQSKHLKIIDWLKELRVFMDIKIYDKIKLEFNQKDSINHVEDIKQRISLLKNELIPLADKLEILNQRKLKIEHSQNLVSFELEMNNFINEQIANEFVSVQLFESFNISVLQFFGENLQKWFAMETAAVSSKESLVNVTSIEGDWYLEEMLTLIRNSSHLSQIIYKTYEKFYKFDPTEETNELSFRNSLIIFYVLESLFEGLNELLINYDVILMEKILKLAFSDEQEMQWVLNEFKLMDLEELFEIMSAENTNELTNPEYIEKINEIKSKYGKILTNRNNKICTEILLEFEKMFSKIDNEFDKLIKFCKIYYTSQDQSVLEQNLFILTSNLVFLFDSTNYSYMKNLFLVKKIQTIYSCLVHFEQYTQYCYGSRNEFMFKQEDFVYPIKNYISEFIVQMVNGVPIILIGNLFNILKNDQYSFMDMNLVNQSEQIGYMINHKILTNQINEYFFNTFNQFLLNIDSFWVNQDLLKRINSNIEYNQTFMDLSKEIIDSIEWYYDPYLVESYSDSLQTKTFREKTLEKLKITMDDLDKKIENFKKIANEFSNNETNISKRLEWSSNSNPNLIEITNQFNQVVETNDLNFKKEITQVDKISHCLKMWFNFEHMRNFKSTQLSQIKLNFENLIKLIEQKGILDREKMPNISEVELNLINFKSFKDRKPLNSSILQEYYKLFYEEVAQMKRSKQKEEKEFYAKIEELNKSASDFKTILNQHSKVMIDIKPILKSMTKFGDNARLTEYSKTYQKFSEICQSLVRFLCKKELIEEDPKDIEEKLIQLGELIHKIYADLKTINDPIEKKIDNIKLETKSTETTIKTLKINQEGNSHAISIWKRVNKKLEGRDPDPNYQMNVQEQVDYLIKEATDLSNLAVLYEGWTPWV
ncbi:unnamed protein product [Brachionus calyciflorus]|uniref:non-specific serine/threonine protein kinase n=1 Tax=Brachionus calyciflorus TaxID=104777 RepID=A0A813RLZ2_9BILA|nr:unnamed protein product [Brachionus calyciflorus]